MSFSSTASNIRLERDQRGYILKADLGSGKFAGFIFNKSEIINRDQTIALEERLGNFEGQIVYFSSVVGVKTLGLGQRAKNVQLLQNGTVLQADLNNKDDLENNDPSDPNFQKVQNGPDQFTTARIDLNKCLSNKDGSFNWI